MHSMMNCIVLFVHTLLDKLPAVEKKPHEQNHRNLFHPKFFMRNKIHIVYGTCIYNALFF